MIEKRPTKIRATFLLDKSLTAKFRKVCIKKSYTYSNALEYGIKKAIEFMEAENGKTKR